MFDRELLRDIDLGKGECRLHECGLSVDNPADNLVLRPLCTDDYDKGKFDLFSSENKAQGKGLFILNSIQTIKFFLVFKSPLTPVVPFFCRIFTTVKSTNQGWRRNKGDVLKYV